MPSIQGATMPLTPEQMQALQIQPAAQGQAPGPAMGQMQGGTDPAMSGGAQYSVTGTATLGPAGLEFSNLEVYPAQESESSMFEAAAGKDYSDGM